MRIRPSCDVNRAIVVPKVIPRNLVERAGFRQPPLSLQAFAQLQAAHSYGRAGIRKKLRTGSERLTQKWLTFPRAASQCQHITQRMQSVEKIFIASSVTGFRQTSDEFGKRARNFARERLHVGKFDAGRDRECLIGTGGARCGLRAEFRRGPGVG